jgi:hypothetical protein
MRMSSAAQSERLVRTGAVVTRFVAGETLIVPVRGKVGDLGSIYKFNGTGTLIWKLLEGSQSLPELCSAVARHYGIEIAQVEIDVTHFVAELKSVGLVELAPVMSMAGD